MEAKLPKLFRLVLPLLLALAASCGSGGNTGDDSTTSTSLISNDDIAPAVVEGERELLVSDTTSLTKTITQCFCNIRFRDTLQIYHFENQNAVLFIEFDNQSRDFDRKGTVYLFDNSTTTDLVSKWINNQYSDGLFVTSATPIQVFEIPHRDITITSEAYIENLSGRLGDEYEKTQINYSVVNQSQENQFFLSGFSDQVFVYLQTSPASDSN